MTNDVKYEYEMINYIDEMRVVSETDRQFNESHGGGWLRAWAGITTQGTLVVYRRMTRKETE